MYRLNDIAFELKLEPILDLRANSVFGFEALSRAIDCDVNNQDFFDALDTDQLLTLLTKQLMMFQKLNEQDRDVYHTVFINISPALFKIATLWMEFIPFIYQFSIHIEIDAKYMAQLKGATTFRNITKLRALGAHFWIDDLDDTSTWNNILWSELDGRWMNITHHLTGVKFDKHFFWQCIKNRGEQERLTKLISIFKHKCTLLVEGVESELMMNSARQYGFVLGQGYYWGAV